MGLRRLLTVSIKTSYRLCTAPGTQRGHAPGARRSIVLCVDHQGVEVGDGEGRLTEGVGRDAAKMKYILLHNIRYVWLLCVQATSI